MLLGVNFIHKFQYKNAYDDRNACMFVFTGKSENLIEKFFCARMQAFAGTVDNLEK